MAGPFSPPIKAYLQDLNQPMSVNVPVPKTPQHIRPGAILAFKYKDERENRIKDRLLLVMRTDRGQGMFISPRGNKLVSGFRITDTMPETLAIILRAIEEDRELFSNYYRVVYGTQGKAGTDTRSYFTGLQTIFDRDSFRTYKLNNIFNLFKVDIDYSLLPA